MSFFKRFWGDDPNTYAPVLDLKAPHGSLGEVDPHVNNKTTADKMPPPWHTIRSNTSLLVGPRPQKMPTDSNGDTQKPPGSTETPLPQNKKPEVFTFDLPGTIQQEQDVSVQHAPTTMSTPSTRTESNANPPASINQVIQMSSDEETPPEENKSRYPVIRKYTDDGLYVFTPRTSWRCSRTLANPCFWLHCCVVYPCEGCKLDKWMFGVFHGYDVVFLAKNTRGYYWDGQRIREDKRLRDEAFKKQNG
jgi:hypothetical protein